jgi:hypothetical protein
VRRDILLFGALAVVALVAGWLLLSNRPGAAIETFKREAKARADAGHAKPVAAEAFRATICSAGPCVVVEAGGLAIVVGAGEGAAEGLSSLGLMRADLDAVVLPDLKLETIAGLPGLARISLEQGRTTPLKVYGPSGIVPVIDGMNLALSGDAGARLAVGTEREDQGLEGLVIFDSGVVAVRAFGGQGRGEGRVYRIDFESKSLVISGCAASPEQIVAAAKGTKVVAGVLAAEAPELIQEGQSSCIAVKEVLEAAGQARLSTLLLSPLRPSVAIPGSLAAWREIVAGGGTVGEPGSVLDLSGKTPVLKPAM